MLGIERYDCRRFELSLMVLEMPYNNLYSAKKCIIMKQKKLKTREQHSQKSKESDREKGISRRSFLKGFKGVGYSLRVVLQGASVCLDLKHSGRR